MITKANHPKIKYMGQYSAGSNLYRVIVYHYNAGEALIGMYEVWATKEAIENNYPNKNLKFDDKLRSIAIDGFEELIKYNEEESKTHSAIFYDKNKSPKYGNYREFPGILTDIDPTTRTNISMPESQYQWIRLQAAKDNCSTSEVVNQIISNHREIKCPKCKGNNVKKTGLAYGIGMGENIPKSNMKQYECLDCKNLFNYPSI